MKIPTVQMILFISWQLRFVYGTMTGNVPTIKNRRMTCDRLLKVLEGTWLANCAHMCVYENDCKSFSFNQKQRRCELYIIDSASAVTGDMVEEEGVVLIDIENWPETKTGACAKKPCGEQSVCLPDQHSNQCIESQSSFQCPVGWVKCEKKCYYFDLTNKNYTEAQSNCKQMRGKLVEPRTASTAELLKTILPKQAAGDWWLGLNDTVVDGDWAWSSDGSPPSYTDWIGLEPNDGILSNCAIFWKNQEYGWGDNPCEETRKSICELV